MIPAFPLDLTLEPAVMFLIMRCQQSSHEVLLGEVLLQRECSSWAAYGIMTMAWFVKIFSMQPAC